MKTKAGTGYTKPWRLATHVALILLCVPFVMPLLWMVSTSLKTDSQIYITEDDAAADRLTLKGFIPNPVDVTNYPKALKAAPFGIYVRNTLLLCTLNVIGAVFSSVLVAYGFARLQFPGKNIIFGITICTMALPGQITMIPIFALFKHLGWYGTFLPLIVPHFFGNAFFIFLLRQFLVTIPEELSEAARIDGANEWDIFMRLILPLTIPALATCALFQFLYTWNDFFGPLLYLSDPSRYTIAPTACNNSSQATKANGHNSWPVHAYSQSPSSYFSSSPRKPSYRELQPPARKDNSHPASIFANNGLSLPIACPRCEIAFFSFNNINGYTLCISLKSI